LSLPFSPFPTFTWRPLHKHRHIASEASPTDWASPSPPSWPLLAAGVCRRHCRPPAAAADHRTVAAESSLRWALSFDRLRPPPSASPHSSLLIGDVGHHRSHRWSPELRQTPLPSLLLRPRRCHVASVRARSPHLAQPSPGSAPVMVGKTLSHGTPPREPRHRGRFACGHRPARVSITPSARSARLKWPWDWPWTEASPALCGDFFSSDFYFWLYF
jgi:hypothetical protein